MEESGTEGMEAAIEAMIQILEHFSRVDELCAVLPGRWEDFHQVFRTIKHFKDFMAMEIGLDMVAFPGSLVGDTHEWTPMGPGGLRGLNRTEADGPCRGTNGNDEGFAPRHGQVGSNVCHMAVARVPIRTLRIRQVHTAWPKPVEVLLPNGTDTKRIPLGQVFEQSDG